MHPCRRVTICVPGRLKSMSPCPNKSCAPVSSNTTWLSKRPETWKQALAAMLALMSGVTMSTLGRWVASTRWMPAARAFCARRTISISTCFLLTRIKSANSSIKQTM